MKTPRHSSNPMKNFTAPVLKISRITKRNTKRSRASFALPAAAMLALLSIPAANATTYYWDGNNNTTGYGNASGTWAVPTTGTTTAGWSTSTAGSVVVLANSVTTGTADVINFGNGATGLGAGTITVSGTVSSGNITFASGSGAIVLSGGTITQAAAEVITVNNATDTINSVLAGAATSFTKAGTGTLILSGNNTYAGGTIVSAGTLNLGGGTATGSLASTVLTLSGGAINYSRTGNTTQSFTTTNINALAPSLFTVAAGNTLNLGTVTRGAGVWLDLSPSGGGTLAASASSNTVGIMGGFTVGDSWAVANGAGSAFTGLANGSYTQTSVAGATSANYTGLNIDVDSSAGALDAAITANSLRFSANAANTVTLTGTTNVISTGGILVGSGVGSNLSTITGGTLAGAASKDLTVVQNSTGGLTISSIIANNGGATGLTKSGAGLLTLAASNTFTGGVFMNSGTLALGDPGALNSTGGSENAVTFNAGSTGTLALGGNSVVVKSINTNATTPGTTFIQNANGSAVSNATLTIGNSAKASSTIASIIQDGTGGGTLALIKAGSGTLTLPGANTYSGGTTISGGTVVISNATSLGASSGNVSVTGSSTINVTGNLTYGNAINVGAALTLKNGTTTASTATYSGVLSGSSNITITNNGTNNNNAIHAFTNAANTFTGNVILPTSGAGNDYFSFNSIGDAGNFTFQKNGNREGIIYAGSSNLVLNTRQINLGTAFQGASGYDGNGNPINTFQSNGAGTVTFNSNMGMTTITTSSVFWFDGTNTGNNTFAGTIANPTSANNLSIGKNGGGTWLLSGANTYLGSTIITNGILSVNAIDLIANAQPLGKGSVIQLGYQSTNGTLVFTGSSNSTTDKQVQLGYTTAAQTGGGSILNNGIGSLTFSNATFNTAIAGVTATRTVSLGGSYTGTNEIQGIIQNNAAAGLVSVNVVGSTWKLSGTNTFTGVLDISAGTLNAASFADYGTASAIGNRAAISETPSGDGIGIHIGSGTTGATLQYTGTTAQSTNREIRLSAATNTIDASGSVPGATLSFTHTGANTNLFDTGGVRTLNLTGSNTGNNTFAITLTDQSTNATSLTKNGIGTWVLAGANTYTGTTTVSAGTLGLSGSLTGSNISTSGSAVFSETALGTVAGTGVTFTQGSSGTSILANSNTYTGATTITAGTLNLSHQNAVQSTTVTMNGGALVFDQSVGGNAFTFGGLAATSSGAGYDIALQNNAGGPAAVALTVGNNGANASYAGVLSGAGSLVKTGSGVQTLTGANTYSGATTINSGATLSLGDGTTDRKSVV